MGQELSHPPPISRIGAGMRVIDAAGVDVGVVDLVQPGDPNAVTVQAATPGAGGTLDKLIGSVAAEEPDVPADAAARLRREGYVKVDAGRRHAVYVEADQISAVDHEAVRLSVLTADLTPEE